MTNTIKNAFEYKLIGVILYFFSSLAGLSILFLYSPSSLLFNENSKIEIIKLNLYKDFAKNIYDNINTPLIKNLTLTKDNESCPENFELLMAKNQYYGNFSKFYGNKSICIERFKNEEYSFNNLIKATNFTYINNNTKKCGELIKQSNINFFMPNEKICPLNNIEINNISKTKNFGNFDYKIGQGEQFLTPIYGNNPKKPVITNIEIINNNKVCLEKYNNIKEWPCEFPDNYECFIDDNYELIYSLDSGENYKLNPSNLARWNLPNDRNIKHNFCKENFVFNIFVNGYINFTQKNFEEFLEEFPSSDFTNNPLYKSYKVFKSTKNIDRIFYLVSFNLFIWSSIHFIIQIMLYIEKKGIRSIYIRNGIILFFFKLFFLLGMIIYYYCFYLKVEKVYLVMFDKPRNKVLQYYSISRKNFILKIIIICLIGFLIVCIDLIVFFFTLTIQWGIVFKTDEKLIETETETKTKTKTETEAEISKKIKKKENPIINNNHIVINDIIACSFGEPNFSNKEQSLNFGSKINQPSYEKQIEMKENPDIKKNFQMINLIFIFKDNLNKSYLIKIGVNELFMKVIELLKNTYSDLKEKKMIIFTYGSNIINKEKTIKENGLSDNTTRCII